MQHLFCRSTGLGPKSSSSPLTQCCVACFSLGFEETTFPHEKVDCFSSQQISCQQTLQGTGRSFLINSVQSRNREPLVLQNTALPRCHDLEFWFCSASLRLACVATVTAWDRLLASVINSFKCMFNFPKDHFLSTAKASYILSL